MPKAGRLVVSVIPQIVLTSNRSANWSAPPIAHGMKMAVTSEDTTSDSILTLVVSF